MAEIIPSEFRSFVRDIGIRAFDRLSARAAKLDTSLRAMVRSWGRLSSQQKDALFDELIEAAQRHEDDAAAAPVERTSRKPLKRYDPAEVEKTLPKKVKVKAAPKTKAKAKAKAKTKPKPRKAPAE